MSLSKKLSGAQGRLARKRKAEKQDAVLQQMPKLEIFFSNKKNTNDTDSSVSSSETLDVSAVSTVPVASEFHNEDTLVDEFNNEPSCSQSTPEKLQLEIEKKNLVFDISDPAKWIRGSNFVNVIIKSYDEISQDPNTLEFSRSKRIYDKQCRFATKKMFFKTMKNGEVFKREWLIYSCSTGAVYCAYCILFSTGTSVFVNGFSNWKNREKIDEHEKTTDHQQCAKTFIARKINFGKLDQQLQEKFAKEENYWNQVLTRVFSVVKFLGTRDLAFRGTEEKFGSHTNGNFLGLLELISQFDPFLKQHIETMGNPGRGHVSYTSKTVCDEFINIISKMIQDKIISEVRKSKYYSIIVDSTPDISHSDQLTLILRYVLENGSPVERFLKFMPNVGHKAADMETAILESLKYFQIEIEDCRGQSYDNASNMSGQYNGLQALIKKRNSLAVYSPCAAHSLNLILQCAADSCLCATKFFMAVQEIYVFFSASTSRWQILVKYFEQSPNAKGLVPKRLNTTRWAARRDALRALYLGYAQIQAALIEISEGENQKNEVRIEAESLATKFQTLEFGIFVVFWSKILDRIHSTSLSMQKINVDIVTITQLYDSLADYAKDLRNDFSQFEEEGRVLSKCVDYETVRPLRTKKRKLQFDEADTEMRPLSPSSKMRIDSFYVIIDNLINELKRRSAAYKEINDLFGFLNNLMHLDATIIKEHATKLYKVYQNDLEIEFIDECVHFKKFLTQIYSTSQQISADELLKLLKSKCIVSTFCNVEISLRIFMTMATSNASAERSFSTLKRVKTYLRNALNNEKTSELACLSINNDMLVENDVNEIIKKFATLKARKVDIGY